MELTETSLDLSDKLVYGKLGQAIREDILEVIELGVSSFLFLVVIIWRRISLHRYFLA